MEPESALPCLQQPLTFSIISQINPVHNLPQYFFKIHFNIILPPMQRS